MNRLRFDHLAPTDPSWLHWAASVLLLSLHMAGFGWALPAAVAVCAAMAVYYGLQLRSIKATPVQIRIAYLGLLLAGAAPGMAWVHWVQLVGTTAMISVGYCLLGRLLSLLPFNRTHRWSWSLVGQALFRDPCAGGLLFWSDAPTADPPCCSLRRTRPSAACSTANRRLETEEEVHPVATC